MYLFTPDSITQRDCDSVDVADLEGIARSIGSAITVWNDPEITSSVNRENLQAVAEKWFKFSFSYIEGGLKIAEAYAVILSRILNLLRNTFPLRTL